MSNLGSCVCGSYMPEERCCGQYLRGEQSPSTALALMRSRYTAFATGKVDYLFDTYCAAWRSTHNKAKFVREYQQVEWVELEIVSVLDGGLHHQTGMVEFIAHYTHNGNSFSLHEKSLFVKEDGLWRYQSALP